MVTKFVIPEVLQARLRRSVLAAGVEPFVLHLTSHGYAPRTIGVYVDAIAHLARWMRRARASFARLDERLIERFIGQHLPRCRCPEPCCRVTSNVRAAGRRFIKVSRQAGLLRASVHGAPAAPELAAFRDYLSVSQGLAESTQRARLRIIADFFRWRFGRKVPRPAQLTVSDVQRFVTAHCVGAAAGNAAVTACALRSYLRFRALAGQAVAALLAAVPAVAQWPLERLPQVLDDTLIQAIEQTFDVSTAGGARDRAMFRLMLDLGLRVSEVARIKLQDIDWRRGVLHIAAGKSRRVDTLPLGRNVAKAIIQYLRVARPPTTLRTLFIRKTAPVDLPIQLDAVRAAMRQAYRRCGHPELCARTHVLRHTAASRMLRAGAPLKQIADVLRHRSLDTTTIYAKVDAVRLAAVAMAWPGSQL